MVSRVSTMILGLLAEGERHGYELVREMEDRGLLRWTRASKVAVYKALARLEEEGCLVSWVEKTGNAPQKRIYAVTREGEERLRELVYALCSTQEPLCFETHIGTAFIGCLNREEAMDALERRLHYIQGQVRRISDEIDVMKGVADDICLAVVRHELAVYREEARLIPRIIDKIDKDKRGREEQASKQVLRGRGKKRKVAAAGR